MSLLAINKEPTRNQLRQFGVISAVAVPLIAWWWNASPQVLLIASVAALMVGVLSFLLPAIIKPLFIALSVITYPIGLVLSSLLMLLIYGGLFVPIGLCFRLLGRDVLSRKIDRQSKTYWQPKKPASGPASYYRQS